MPEVINFIMIQHAMNKRTLQMMKMVILMVNTDHHDNCTHTRTRTTNVLILSVFLGTPAPKKALRFNMQNFEKGYLSFQKSKKIFLFFMGDESPYAHNSKFMIGFVPSAQQPILKSSKVQNCQNRGQLLRGCL